MSDFFTTTYPALADRLQQTLPAGVWVDLDQGQIEAEAAGLSYSLPFAEGVVLIGFDEVDWQDLGGGVQAGEAIIRFTLAREVVQDTYQHSTQRGAALQQLQLLTDLHRALQHYAVGEVCGALVRVDSRKEPASRPGLWVYSMAYKARAYDAEGHPVAPAAAVAEVAPTPGQRPRRPMPAESAGVFLS
jgi:hypothetical protein